MVASVGTIIVQPPDGHMATYVTQLERLADLRPNCLLPAHGSIIDAPIEHLRFYIEHRLGREKRVVAALAQGSAPLALITQRSYEELPSALLPLAERSCLAHLIKLEEEARAELSDGQWRLRP